jgi:hypothetical protein
VKRINSAERRGQAIERNTVHSTVVTPKENSAAIRDKIFRAMGLIPILKHRRCTVCSHLRRGAIEKGIAHGRSLRELSKKYGVTKSAIHRHNHHSEWRFPRLVFSNLVTGQVRGNPDKTKPFRWRPGESGNPGGRPLGRKSAVSEARELRKMIG